MMFPDNFANWGFVSFYLLALQNSFINCTVFFDITANHDVGSLLKNNKHSGKPVFKYDFTFLDVLSLVPRAFCWDRLFAILLTDADFCVSTPGAGFFNELHWCMGHMQKKSFCFIQLVFFEWGAKKVARHNRWNRHLHCWWLSQQLQCWHMWLLSSCADDVDSMQLLLTPRSQTW